MGAPDGPGELPRWCEMTRTDPATSAIRRRAAVDEKYRAMVNDSMRWYSEGKLSYKGMRASVKNALHFWREDREAIGS